LNRRQYIELVDRHGCGPRNRSPTQDALTLFDEGGVIVAAGDAELAALLRAREWKQLFWAGRAAVIRHLRFYLFGPAPFAKALNPFPGVTGRGVIVEVTDAFFPMSLADQVSVLDGKVAAQLNDPNAFLSTDACPPIPILGVPGWCEDNVVESYYDNHDCF